MLGDVGELSWLSFIRFGISFQVVEATWWRQSRMDRIIQRLSNLQIGPFAYEGAMDGGLGQWPDEEGVDILQRV